MTRAAYQGIELLRRTGTEAVEFVTLMWFDSLDDVRAFAGSVPVLLDDARECVRCMALAAPDGTSD
ncbi:MAG: hypothetical protein ACREOC_06290 [Gemmatimonadales bacterium]